MTHDKIKALDELIAAVESGAIARSDLDAFIPSLGLNTQANDAHSAYKGSLDAAKALHDALVPGWHLWALEDEDAVYCGWTAVMCKRQDRDVCVCVSNQHDPARAWLIAILKAYRSITEGSE